MASGLCSSNLSIGILITMEGRVVWIKNNKINGIAGQVSDSFVKV